MKRAVLINRKLYIREIEDLEADLDNIEEFVSSNEPVIIFEDELAIDDLAEYFTQYHDDSTMIVIESTEEDEDN